jgi:hypothetical protein
MFFVCFLPAPLPTYFRKVFIMHGLSLYLGAKSSQAKVLTGKVFSGKDLAGKPCSACLVRDIYFKYRGLAWINRNRVNILETIG